MTPEEVLPGTCFLYKAQYSPVHHLHIVVATKCASLKEDECIMVNLTTAIEGEMALGYKVGDHPYITRPCAVNFEDAEITTRTIIAALVTANPAILQQRFDLTKVREIGLKGKAHSAVIGKIKTALSARYLG